MNKVILTFDNDVDIIAIISALATVKVGAKLISVTQENHTFLPPPVSQSEDEIDLPPCQEYLVRFLATKPEGKCALSEVAKKRQMPIKEWGKKMRSEGRMKGSKNNKFYTADWVYKEGERIERLYVLTDAGREWVNKHPH